MNLPRLLLPLALLPAALLAEPTVEKTTWRELPAFRLSDGRTEAVVVPQLGGRCVSYGLVGGWNWLWTGEPGSERRNPTLHWGGDKTYLGPHTLWSFYRPMWPPPLPDHAAHEVEQLDGGRLRTTSPVWEPHGAKFTREYAWDAGELVVTHSFAPAPGSHALGAVWTVTQIIPTDFVYVPLHPQSPYRDNVFWFAWSKQRGAEAGANMMSPTLLEIRPTTGTLYKLGASPTQPALAAVKGGVLFLQKSAPQEGQYPEGADGAGLSIEVYHHDAAGPGEYTELEMMSPLRRLDQGAKLITRWSLHPVPKDGARAMVVELFGKP